MAGEREETKARDAYKTAAAEMKKTKEQNLENGAKRRNQNGLQQHLVKKLFLAQRKSHSEKTSKIDAANERKWVFGQLHDWTDSVETENGSQSLKILQTKRK